MNNKFNLKSKKCFTALFIFLFIFKLAFSQVTFNKTYDQNNLIDGIHRSMIENNSGYFIVGQSWNPGNFLKMIVFQTDFNGDTLWSKSYGQNYQAFGINDIFLDADGNYVVAGTGSWDYLTNFGMLAKLTPNGDTLWTKGYRFPQFLYTVGVQTVRTYNYNYAFIGNNYDTNANFANACFFKLDSMGNMIDTVNFPSSYQNLVSIAETDDHGFLICGWAFYPFATAFDFILVKTDSAGNEQWHKTFGTIKNDWGLGIQKLSDGNFLIYGGAVVLNPTNVENGKIYKIDESGNIIWEKSYSFGANTDEIRNCFELSNHDIGIIAVSKNSPAARQAGLVMRIDSSGALKWHRIFQRNVNLSNNFIDDLYGGISTSDGGILAGGWASDSAMSTPANIWLIKLDSLGCDSAGCANYTTGVYDAPYSGKNDREFIIYPNPAKDILFVKLLHYRQYETFTITIMNSLGQQVLKRKLHSTENALPVFINEFPKGFYLVRCEVDDKYFSEKFIKE